MKVTCEMAGAAKRIKATVVEPLKQRMLRMLLKPSINTIATESDNRKELIRQRADAQKQYQRPGYGAQETSELAKLESSKEGFVSYRSYERYRKAAKRRRNSDDAA